MAWIRHFGPVDLHVDMLWMVPNVRATWCGLKGMGNPMFFWTPPQLTRFLWIMSLFAHWA